MKLHYSQTLIRQRKRKSCVLVPYEITLLSNYAYVLIDEEQVLVPYEITLLSNKQPIRRTAYSVLVPYEITLLSNSLASSV